jgi:F-type H+-transporting ATPase subunit alpha
VAEMAISLLAANEGYLDDVDVNKIVEFEAALHAHVRAKNGDLLDQINASGDFNDDIAAEMKVAIEDFKANGAY